MLVQKVFQREREKIADHQRKWPSRQTWGKNERVRIQTGKKDRFPRGKRATSFRWLRGTALEKKKKSQNGVP